MARIIAARSAPAARGDGQQARAVLEREQAAAHELDLGIAPGQQVAEALEAIARTRECRLLDRLHRDLEAVEEQVGVAARERADAAQSLGIPQSSEQATLPSLDGAEDGTQDGAGEGILDAADALEGELEEATDAPEDSDIPNL